MDKSHNQPIKAYIINMRRDVYKRRAMEKQLEKFSLLGAEFVEGFDGQQLPESDLKALVDQEALHERYHGVVTLPAIGCSLSHHQLYERIAQSDHQVVLILEDDAILAPHIIPLLHDLIPHIMGAAPSVVLLTPEFSYRERDLAFSVKEYGIYRLLDGCMTSGYLINKAAAIRLWDFLMPIRYLADDWGRLIEAGIYLYGIVPHAISYPEGYGEIGHSVLKVIRDRKSGWMGGVSIWLGKIKVCMYNFISWMSGFRKAKKRW